MKCFTTCHCQTERGCFDSQMKVLLSFIHYFHLLKTCLCGKYYSGKKNKKNISFEMLSPVNSFGADCVEHAVFAV